MAKCPKCGRKLHLWNIKPVCPDCGINLNYYKSNERLLDESEKSEIEHSKFQPKVDRAKAATIGTTIGKIRMGLFLIPIAAVFLPLFTITVSGNKQNYNAIELYNLYSSLNIGALFENITPLILAILFVAVPVVCCIIFTIMQIASGTKKGLKRNIVLSCISLFLVGASIGSIIAFSQNPANAYAKIIINEADYAIENGDQTVVDTAVQKIRNIYADTTVDTEILEDAIANGEATLAVNGKYGQTEDEIASLKTAVDNGKQTLADTSATIDDVRSAASDINSANYTYSKLQTSVNNAINNALEQEDEIYTDEYYNDLVAVTDETTVYIQNVIDYAKSIERENSNHDYKYTEASYNNLQSAIETAQDYINKLSKGELIVELLDDDGSGNKTDKELAQETAETLQNSFNDLNNSLSGLTNQIALVNLDVKLQNDIDNGTFDEVAGKNITAGLGIGLIVLIVLYIIQFVFNIFVLKKGFEVEYTECLIGGIPSKEYFEMVEQGMSNQQIRRKMLVALAKMQDEEKLRQEAEEKKAEEDKLNEIKARLAEKEAKEKEVNK